jgi:hypothetical protein
MSVSGGNDFYFFVSSATGGKLEIVPGDENNPVNPVSGGTAPILKVGTPTMITLVRASSTTWKVYQDGRWAADYSYSGVDTKTIACWVMDQEQDACGGSFQSTQNTNANWYEVSLFNGILSAADISKEFGRTRGRYTRTVELLVDGDKCGQEQVNSTTAVTDRAATNTYMGRSLFTTDAYLNADIAGVFVVDEYLGTGATSAIADTMVQGVDLTDNSETSTCRHCAAGTSKQVNASDPLASCIACSAGKYLTAGISKCTNCTAGTYSNAAASTCTACPANSNSPAGSSECS